MVTTIKSADARAHFADLVDRARTRGDRIIIEKNGKAAVALISVADLELLERLEAARDARDFIEAKAEADADLEGFSSYAEYRARRLARSK